jgi:hypothetical protein
MQSLETFGFKFHRKHFSLYRIKNTEERTDKTPFPTEVQLTHADNRTIIRNMAYNKRLGLAGKKLHAT